MSKRNVLLFLIVTFLSFSTQAVPLRRGVNISGRFFRGHPGELAIEEMKFIKSLGFDHVRLAIDPEYFVPLRDLKTINKVAPILNPALMTGLLNTVKLVVQNDLIVILDIHPSSSFQKKLFSDAKRSSEFVALWAELAEFFSNIPAQSIYFSVLNEPETKDVDVLLQIQTRLIAAIRKGAPNHKIIISGPNGGQNEDLVLIKPIISPGVLYDFHFYRPGIFTHQGLSYAIDYYANLHVPYPFGPPETIKLYESLTTLSSRQHFERTYLNQTWNSSRIDSKIEEVDHWSKRWGVQVVCEEFGVSKVNAAEKDRATWIQDVRKALEKRGIGWALWEFEGGFGLVEQKKNKKEADSAILEALGLKQDSK